MELDFYDKNDRLFFPLIAYASLLTTNAGIVLPKLGLVDAGFMMGIDADFDASRNVTLYSVIRSDSSITFVFRSDVPALTSYELRFTFDVATPFGCSAYESCNHIGSLSTFYTDLWSGFLTIGDLSQFAALTDGTYVLDTSVGVRAHVEKALIQNLKSTFVRSIKLANDARRCPTTCCDEAGSFTSTTFAVNSGTGVAGDVKIKPGYSAVVEVRPVDNTIAIGAVKGAGAGPACKDVIIDESGMRTDPDSENVPQCDSCDSYIRSINGIAFPDGRAFIESGSSVIIVPDPANHLLHIRFKGGVSSL